MNTKQKVGLYTIVPLFISAVGCTFINRPKTNLNKEKPESTFMQDSVTKKYDIFDQYNQATADYTKGIISIDSFQNINKTFDAEMKYVECGD